MHGSRVKAVRENYDQRIPLGNAKTLRPWVKKSKYMEIVPIFYRRNP